MYVRKGNVGVCTFTMLVILKDMYMYMYILMYIYTTIFTQATNKTCNVHVHVHEHVHVHVTHAPSSQGWTPKCPVHFVFFCLYFTGVVCWVRVSFLLLFLYDYQLCGVLYTCSFMFTIHTLLGVGRSDLVYKYVHVCKGGCV